MRLSILAGFALGLALVAAIADLHGAKLSLSDNSPGLIVEVNFAERPPGSPRLAPWAKVDVASQSKSVRNIVTAKGLDVERRFKDGIQNPGK